MRRLIRNANEDSDRPGHAALRDSRNFERTAERVLAAAQGNVVWMVMKEVFLLVALGVGVGVPAALGRHVS